MSEPLLLLDTHVWLWLMNGSEPLKSSPALQAIERAVRPARIRVAAISVWEVGMLEAKGRVILPLDCGEWVRRALAAPGISLTGLSPEIAIASSRLPGGFHGDPADRIIVATARHLDAALVTRDWKIVEYARNGYISVVPV